MTRFAPALIKARDSEEARHDPVPHAPAAPANEDIQDRLGAQASFQAGNLSRPPDPWAELAEIVRRMIRSQSVADQYNQLDPLPGSRPPLHKAPLTKDSAGAPDPAPAGDRPPVPLEPATAPSNDPQLKLLSGNERPPGPTPIDVPKFPEAKKEPTSGGGEGGVPSAPKRAKAAGQTPKEETSSEGETPEFIVHQWQGAVNSAAGEMPREKVLVRADVVADVDDKKKGAKDRNKKAREGLTEDAKKNVPKAPEVEDPPPPPPSNPVPEHTEKILAASGKRLPDQEPPALILSDRIEDKNEPLVIEPKSPVIGEQAVPSDLFNVLISPQAQEAAKLPAKDAKGPDGKADPEARRIEAALKQLSNTGDVKVPEGEGEQIISKDTGSEPMPPLPPGLEVPVGQVVARLLAQADQTSKAVLDGLRTQAYAGGVLKKHFPEIGESMLGDLSQQVNTELRDIAAAANISADQLETMIGERRKELETSAGEAKKEAEAKGKEAVDATKDEGQQTMDAVAGAAKAAEEETLRRQEAAGGASDPTVINRRRDLTVNWITEHVTTQTTNYQLAGEKRTKELTGVRKQQNQAYEALAQRLEFQIMTPDEKAGRKPRDTQDLARERRLADLSIQVKTWKDEVVKRVGEMFRKSIKFIDDETKANRKAVESAGTSAREAARQWAEDKILEGQSWWKRFIARITRWLDEADNLNEEWRVRRTRENRDSIAKDLVFFENAKEKLAKYATEDAIEADKSLTEAQKTLLKQAFRARNPLEFAAERLKQTIATSHLNAARAIFEKELMAVAPTKENAEKLNEIVHAMGDSGFDGAKIAQECHAAMDQWGTDEDRIFRNLKGLTGFKGKIVRIYYTAMGFGDLDADLDSELSGDEYRRAQAQIDGKVAAADAIALHDALDRLNTDEAAVMELLRNKTPEEVEAITAEYQSRYGKSLDQALKDDLDEGNELDQATALKNGDTATADAIALDEAMRGGIISSGTDEAEIEKVQTRVRDEVLAKAKAENWTSQQMEAEVRRRMGAIDKKFGEKYANVEQYNQPGLTGSVLKRAFASELSGAELDLANALQDNDLTKADAARVEIERTGFYASDDKLVKVMRSQYERALEARRLDEGPARHMRVQREVDKWRDQVPALSEEQISRKRMALERQMEKELDAGATKDAKVSTEALRDAYEGKYKRNLAYTLSLNMSGREHDTAMALLKNGGKLSPLQEIELATKGDGTDEDSLKKTFKTMTKAEIAEVRRQWEARNPGKSFDEMVRGELSGRDESDIMDMVEHGAPESAKEQIAQEVRRVKREREDLTGIVGQSAAGSEDEWMQFQAKRLQELETDLDRTDWPPGEEGKRQREALMGKVEFRVQRVQDAVEDHRRKIDSVTDSIAQVASIVAAVVVGAIVTVLTAGMAGPAAIALVALASSVAGTLATVATKRLVMGGAYGAEDFAGDLAVGVVDAVVSVATAGVGNRFMKLGKGIVGKLPLGGIAKLVTKPGAMIGGALAKTSLASTAIKAGESGLVTKALKTPFLGGALHSAGGSIKSAGRALSNPAELLEATGKFIGRSAENVVTAIPTTIAQLGVSDQTWKGDPLANFVDGIVQGSWQAFYMGHLIAGPAELAQKSLIHGLHSRTEVGKMHLASQMVQERFGEFREKNNGASIGDFLMHPEGRKLRAEIDRMGLLPTIDSVNKKIAADPAAKAKLDHSGPEGAPSSKNQADARTAQMEAALPKEVRDKTVFVTPDPDLKGNSVHVEPLRIGDQIIGVEIRVGPDATPLDVAMHAATAHVMQKYAGISDGVFKAMERFGSFISGSGVHMGKRGWEANLEIAKLPAIIDARLKALEGQMVTPELAMRLQADIDSLTAQFHEHEAILHDEVAGLQEGRGFVAAEDKGKPALPDEAAVTKLIERIDGSKDNRRLREKMLERALRGEINEARSIRQKLADKLGVTPDVLMHAILTGSDRALARITDPSQHGPAELQALRAEREASAEASRELDKLVLNREDHQEILQWLAREIQADRSILGPGEFATKIFQEMTATPLPVSAFAFESARPTAPDLPQAQFNGLTTRNKGFGLNARDARTIAKELDLAIRRSEGDARTEAIKKAYAKFDELLRRRGINLSDGDFDRAVLWMLGEHGPSLKSRLPEAKSAVDATRQPPEKTGLPPGLQNAVFEPSVHENAQAMARIKQRIADTKPDIVFGVQQGGAFFLDAARPRSPQISPTRHETVPKGADNSRTTHLEPAIRQSIADGKRKFATIDSYMGGTASKEFIEMFGRIVADIARTNPRLAGEIKLDMIWIREGVGMERNIPAAMAANPDLQKAWFDAVMKPDHAALEALVKRYAPTDKDWWQPATQIPTSLRQNITEHFEHVRFVIGDDMQSAYRPNAQAPVAIFDPMGNFVAIIMVGMIDPQTGLRMNSTREIMIALINGSKFWP
ncbi:MAG: hypothetical protein ACRCS9_15735 [Hyphomicrobium sp.]